MIKSKSINYRVEIFFPDKRTKSKNAGECVKSLTDSDKDCSGN